MSPSGKRQKPTPTDLKKAEEALKKLVGDTSGPEWAPKLEEQKRGPKYRAPPKPKKTAADGRGHFHKHRVNAGLWKKVAAMAERHGYDTTLELIVGILQAAIDGEKFVPENRASRVELHEMRATVRAQDRLKEAAFERAKMRGEIISAGDRGKLPLGLSDPRLEGGASGGHRDDRAPSIPRR